MFEFNDTKETAEEVTDKTLVEMKGKGSKRMTASS